MTSIGRAERIPRRAGGAVTPRSSGKDIIGGIAIAGAGLNAMVADDGGHVVVGALAGYGLADGVYEIAYHDGLSLPVFSS